MGLHGIEHGALPWCAPHFEEEWILEPKLGAGSEPAINPGHFAMVTFAGVLC
jgi:hypothetical protein